MTLIANNSDEHFQKKFLTQKFIIYKAYVKSVWFFLIKSIALFL